jgi:hypothetical protein
VFGVVRGRVWEYIELTSAVCCLVRAGDESICDVFETFEVVDTCGCDLEEPPPNTRLKNPGLGATGAAGEGDGAPREATVGEGADGSCHEGTGGKSRNVLALTNSCA